MNTTGRAIMLTLSMTLLTPTLARAVKPEDEDAFTWQVTTRIVDEGESISHRAGVRVIEKTSTPPWRYTPSNMSYTPKTDWIHTPKRDWSYTPKRNWTYSRKSDFTYKPKRYSRWLWRHPQPKRGPQIVVFSEATPE